MTIHFYWWKEPAESDYSRYQYSNMELVKNAMVEMSRYGDVVFHHSNHRGRVTDDPNDILFGHPPWPQVAPAESWVFDNGLQAGAAHPNTFLMYPWALAYRTAEPVVDLIRASRALFGMGGLHHYDANAAHATADTTWRQTQHKLIRVNMGCDTRLLPYKKDYSRRLRGLLHISSLMPYKRPELLFASLPPVDLKLYLGTFHIGHVQDLREKGHIRPDLDLEIMTAFNNSSPTDNAKAIESCAFYIHTASEPQATTILENCARGLVPIVHPESGFQSPHAVYLTDDPDENQRIIAEALSMPDDEYRERSRGVRQQIMLYHSWSRIFMNLFADIHTMVGGGEVHNRRGDAFS